MSKKVYNGVDAYVGYKAIIEHYVDASLEEKIQIERIHELTKPNKNARTKIEFIKEYNKLYLDGVLINSLDSLIELYKVKKPDEVVVKFNLTITEGQDGYDSLKGTNGTLFIATLFGSNIKLRRIISFGENPNIPNVDRVLNKTIATRNQRWNFEVLVDENGSQEDDSEKKIIKAIPVATMVFGDGSSYRGVPFGGCVGVKVDVDELVDDGYFILAGTEPCTTKGDYLPLTGGCWQWKIELNGKPWYYGEDIYKVTVEGVEYHAIKRTGGYRLLWLADCRMQRAMGVSFRSGIVSSWDSVQIEHIWKGDIDTSLYTTPTYYSPNYYTTIPTPRRATDEERLNYSISYDPF